MKRIGLLWLIVIGIVSCEGEKKTEPVLLENIRGKWLIENATRNNKETKLLRDGYIEITDSSFVTNLFKDEKPYKYAYDGRRIIVLDDRSSLFDVKSVTSDTLIVWTKYQKFEFKLKTVKAKPSND